MTHIFTHVVKNRKFGAMRMKFYNLHKEIMCQHNSTTGSTGNGSAKSSQDSSSQALLQCSRLQCEMLTYQLTDLLHRKQLLVPTQPTTKFMGRWMSSSVPQWITDRIINILECSLSDSRLKHKLHYICSHIVNILTYLTYGNKTNKENTKN